MPAFTTIALATSTAATVAGTGMSFAQAGKQRKAADKAREAAQKAVEEAKAQMGVNYLEALSLPTQAYEAQREAVGHHCQCCSKPLDDNGTPCRVSVVIQRDSGL